MEITLDDLLVLEPRLASGKESYAASDTDSGLRRAVSWVVSARTTAPHLPVLRGGEVVLIPSRVTAIVGRDLPALLREAALRDVGAVAFQRDEPRAGNRDSTNDAIPVLYWDGELTAET